MHRTARLRACATCAAITLLTLAPRLASAHFTLMEPACYSEQDGLGTPLKSAPCGQADPGNPLVTTGEVTTLVQGGTLTLTLRETIAHPGHYRIAIAPDMASLPQDPPVTAGSTPCGSAPIDAAPVLPVLADGVFVHTTTLRGPQTLEIPLPPDFTCDACVVQVTEFMSNHGLNNPGGCFYHHCANVVVAPASASDAGVMSDAGLPADAGMDAGSAADSGASDASAATDGGSAPRSSASGCGCRIGATRGLPKFSLVALLGLALFARRTRGTRRAHGAS